MKLSGEPERNITMPPDDDIKNEIQYLTEIIETISLQTTVNNLELIKERIPPGEGLCMVE